jgi:hypothetical protein
LARRTTIVALTFVTTTIGLIRQLIAEAVSATTTTTTKAVFITLATRLVTAFTTILVEAVFTMWAVRVEFRLRRAFAAFATFALSAFHGFDALVAIIGFVLITRDHHFCAGHKGWLHGAQDAEIMFRML